MRAAPLHREKGAHRHFVGRIGGGEQIAIRPMFQLVTEWVFPIVEDLAAHDVAADTPCRLPLLLLQILVTQHEIVEIGDLERGVQQPEFSG